MAKIAAVSASLALFLALLSSCFLFPHKNKARPISRSRNSSRSSSDNRKPVKKSVSFEEGKDRALATMHSACQVGGSLFYCFSFTCPVLSGSIERDPIRNVFDMTVKLPIASVLIISLRFLNLGAASGGMNRGCSRLRCYKHRHGLH